MENVIEFLDRVFTADETVRRTLWIPKSHVVNGELIDQVAKKVRECFVDGAQKGLVYFRQTQDGYEVRSYSFKG